MSRPLGFIAALLNEAAWTDCKHGLPAGTAAIQILGLAASFGGHQFRFTREDEVHDVRIPLVVATGDPVIPGWMLDPWNQVLEFQDQMERQERSILGKRMKPHEHRELRRTRDTFLKLGWGFERQLQEINSRLAAAKLTLNIDLVHEVGRLGGHREADRPPVGNSLMILANGEREIRSLISAGKKGSALWPALAKGGIRGYSMHSWCAADSLSIVFGSELPATLSETGYLLRADAETLDERIVLNRSTAHQLLGVIRDQRISGRIVNLAPLAGTVEKLENASASLLEGLPSGYVHQARYIGLSPDLVWHFATLFLSLLLVDVPEGDTSSCDAIDLAAALSRRLLVDHLSFLSTVRPVGPDGPLSTMHRRFINRLAKGPSTIRDLQRAQRSVHKNRCLEVMADLIGLGLVESADASTYLLSSPPGLGLSEMLSDFIESTKCEQGPEEEALQSLTPGIRKTLTFGKCEVAHLAVHGGSKAVDLKISKPRWSDTHLRRAGFF